MEDMDMHHRSNRRAAGAVLLLIILVLVGPATGQEPKIVRMESRTFPNPIVWDSNYTACLAASDGRVYVGLNFHGAGASVAVYDPKTDRMRLLGDMNRITGQTNLAIEPQAKVHSQICEGADGRIYFGTHLSAFYGFATFPSPDMYPGGHWMVYDPKTDVVTDLGIALKGNGLITMTIDSKRVRLYAVTYPQGHFLIYDVATGKTTDMGQVQNWDALSRTLAVDDLGRVYGCWGHGKIYRYDPEREVLENLQVELPQRERGVPIHRAYWETEQTFTAVAHSPDHKKIYFLETGSSYLVEYDPHDGREGRMKLLGQIAADRYLGKRDVPYAMISFCRGPDNVIYYACNSAAGNEEVTPYWGGGMAAGLVTYDLNTGRREDRGLIRVEDGLTAVHPNAASAAPDGTVYFVAHVLEPEGQGRSASGLPADLVLEKDTLNKKQMHAGRTYTLRLLIYKPGQDRGKGGRP
jgi:sugar lactone lactonase YvrE